MIRASLNFLCFDESVTYGRTDGPTDKQTWPLIEDASKKKKEKQVKDS